MWIGLLCLNNILTPTYKKEQNRPPIYISASLRCPSKHKHLYRGVARGVRGVRMNPPFGHTDIADISKAQVSYSATFGLHVFG